MALFQKLRGLFSKQIYTCILRQYVASKLIFAFLYCFIQAYSVCIFGDHLSIRKYLLNWPLVLKRNLQLLWPQSLSMHSLDTTWELTTINLHFIEHVLPEKGGGGRSSRVEHGAVQWRYQLTQNQKIPRCCSKLPPIKRICAKSVDVAIF